MNGHVRIQMVIVAVKMSCHCGVIIVLDSKVIYMTSIYDSIFCLSYIFSMAPVAFQAIYQVITLASAFSDCIVGFIELTTFR